MSLIPSRPRAKPYTRYDVGSWHDLKIIIPSLLIGICLGAGGFYLTHSLPQTRQVDTLTGALTTEKAARESCSRDQIQLTHDLETTRHQLTACQADLQNNQRPAAALPPPVLPPPVLPVEPAPPTPSPAAAPFVWPQDWPPQPAIRPTPPVTTALRPSAPSARAQSPLSSGSTRLTVGQEVTLGGSLQVRLVAVSQRSNGSFCIIGGDGFDSVRIASGTSKSVTRAGRPLTLTARVEDSDTCQVSVKPN
jgi:hypothetical protein